MMALREEDGNTETGTVAAAGEGHLYTSQQNGICILCLLQMSSLPLFVSYIMYVAGSLDGPLNFHIM